MKLDDTLARALRDPTSAEAIAKVYLTLVEPDPAGCIPATPVRNRVRELLRLPPKHLLKPAEALAGIEWFRDDQRHYLKARWK